MVKIICSKNKLSRSYVYEYEFAVKKKVKGKDVVVKEKLKSFVFRKNEIVEVEENILNDYRMKKDLELNNLSIFKSSEIKSKSQKVEDKKDTSKKEEKDTNK